MNQAQKEKVQATQPEEGYDQEATELPVTHVVIEPGCLGLNLWGR